MLPVEDLKGVGAGGREGENDSEDEVGVTSFSTCFCLCHVLSLLQAARSHISLIIAADPPEAQISWNPASGVINSCCVPGFQVFPGLRG